jgi:hypothetical protein
MVTAHRAYGFRFVIFTNDHSPPHVHIVGQGGEAKVTLAGGEPRIEWSRGISSGDLRRLKAEAAAKADHLLNEWRRIHG